MLKALSRSFAKIEMRKLKRGELICIDTHIVIWGILKEARPHDQAFIEKAEHFFEECSELNIKVIIPSVVLGEVLAGCEPSDKPDFLQYIQQKFIIAPYDQIASYYFSEMWRNKEELKKAQGNVEAITITRAALKADFMIIATAMAQQAQCIYTREINNFRNFAQNSIDIEPLPGYSKQLKIN